MKRRTLLAGIGAAASGSGAIATSAAVANSVQTTSQLSIVVDERLEVRAGKAFNDDGSVKNESKYTDQYVPYDENSSFFDEQDDVLADIKKDEIPIATVNRRDENTNDDVKIQTAISIDNNTDTFQFENILEIENYGGTRQDIGISYDRTDSTYDPNGQYGEDIDLNAGAGDTTVSTHDAQSIYRFVINNDSFTNYRISPDQENGDSDEPTNYYVLDPGNMIQIDLNINLEPYFSGLVDPKENIESASETTPTFQGSTDTVDLLDAISIVRDS